MILEKYKPNFEALDAGQSQYLSNAMHLPEVVDTGLAIYEIADAAGLDQADVVMSLAVDITPVGIQTVEALIGKPIVRRATPTPKTSRGPRRSVSVKRSDPRKIVFVSEVNPKKEGSASHARFALYKVGMSIDEFVAAGGTLGDVKWDAERSFIKIEGQE